MAIRLVILVLVVEGGEVGRWLGGLRHAVRGVGGVVLVEGVEVEGVAAGGGEVEAFVVLGDLRGCVSFACDEMK